jgi:hypothetical protein
MLSVFAEPVVRPLPPVLFAPDFLPLRRAWTGVSSPKRMPHKLKECGRIAASNLSQDQGSVRREAVHIRPSRLGLRKLRGLNGGFP